MGLALSDVRQGARRERGGGLNLLVRAVASALADVATAKGLANARVDWKTNKRGELVIAIIVPPKFPGEWDR